MNNLREQHTFDVVKEHLLSMETPSLLPNGDSSDCAYHGENGGRCAIGIILPDYVYSESFELESIDSLMEAEQDVIDALMNEGYSIDPEFLVSLQQIHDSFFTNMEEHLVKLAIQYELRYES